MFKISPVCRLRLLALLFTSAILSGCGGSNSLSSPQSVSISPSRALVLTGGSQTFSVASMGLNAWNRSVTWAVNGVLGGNSAIGTIDSEGVYSAPTTLPRTSSVVVTAVVDSSVSAPATVELYEAGKGKLTVGPSSFAFGNVAVGSSSTLTGTLTANKSSVKVYTASWNGPGFSLSGISFPLTIPAGETVHFTATFAPQSPGAAAGEVSFFANANNSATQQLVGYGVTQQHKVDLNWGSMPSVQGYYVYRGGQTGGPFVKISSLQPGTSFIDSSVISGQTYYYVVTSLSGGSESNYSNEAEAAIP